jgi:putative ABC transport system permease protein
MLSNHLKTAWRSFAKNRSVSFINIAGLAVGMAVALLIGLWITDELSYNTYHRNYDRIVQVRQTEKFLGSTRVWSNLPFRLLNELQTNYKEDFTHVAAAISTDGLSIAFGETRISTPGLFIDSAAPEMLTLKMLKGSPNALKTPHSILLSASIAKALFGNTDPLGKPVNLKNAWDPQGTLPVTVTGVYEDLPQNSSFSETKFFVPWELYLANHAPIYNSGWEDHRFQIYAELRPNVSVNNANSRISDLELNLIRHLSNAKDEVAANPKLFLNPMSQWHLYSDFKDGVVDKGPAQFLWLVGIIGGFVLLLACINFMNLSTARSERRAREVGIRKAIGSLRGQLIRQFFTESFLVVALAFTGTLALVTLSLPAFNNLAAKQLSIPWTNPAFWLLSAGFIALTALTAGSYPALYLSSFKPIQVLKGTAFRAGRGTSIARKALVILQFTVSISLIISTIVVYKQLLFAKDRPVGYTRDGLLMIPMQTLEYTGKYDLFRSELKKTGAVTEMAESESALTDVSSHNGGFTWKGKPADLEEDFGTLTVTHEYGKTIGWTFIAGRDFSRAYADSTSFVINETAARYMGLQHPVGETLHWKSKWLGFDKNFTIVGVVRDVLMQSPYAAIKPTIFRLGVDNANWIYVRLNPNTSAATALPRIESVFRSLTPASPFEYKFADEEFAKKFTTEARIGKLATLFAILAVFISCLGLFGMASFMAEQRTKEIGVRKVLGASVLNLWGLLSKDFVALVALSLLIAAPTAYVVMHHWLLAYRYRTPISWWIFAASGGGALLITLLTVSLQSIRAATANPVQSLRSE